MLYTQKSTSLIVQTLKLHKCYEMLILEVYHSEDPIALEQILQ
jgi:hypothetical protein